MKRFYTLFFILLSASVFYACLEDPDMPDNPINTEAPTIANYSIGRIKADSIQVLAKITRHNGTKATSQGYYYVERYGDHEKKSISVTGMTNNDGTITFDTVIGNLRSDTEYILSAFAKNAKGENIVVIDTIQTSNGLGNVATLVPNALTDSIKGQSVLVGGIITQLGEGTILERGILYSVSSDSLNVDGSRRDSVYTKEAINPFYCEIKDLETETKYYVRAYVKGIFGTYKGKIDSLTTKDGKPIVDKLMKVGEPGYGTVTLKAEVTNEGDSEVVTRGFCLSKGNTYPTVENDTIIAGYGTGEFEKEITGLDFGSIYYVRAFAGNSFGYTYSEPLSVIILNPDPVVETINVEFNEDGIAIVTGKLLSEGRSMVKAVGFCWSEDINPTIKNDTVVCSIEGGNFTGIIRGLRGASSYFFRTFAINAIDTVVYGDWMLRNTPAIFKPESEDLPITEDYISNSVAYSNPNSNGNIFLLGGDIGPSYTNRLWMYSSIYSWPEKKSFTGGNRKWQTAVCVGKKLYVLGGINESNMSATDFYSYNPDDNEWTMISSGLLGRHSAVGISVGNAAFYFGGRRDGNPLSDVLAYEESAGWSSRVSLPVAQYGGIAIKADSSDVIYTGLGTKAGDTFNNQLWSSSDHGSSWTSEVSFPESVDRIIGGVFKNDCLYVFDSNTTIWEYNTMNKTWKRKSTLDMSGMSIHCIFKARNTIYVGVSNKTIHSYNPAWDN